MYCFIISPKYEEGTSMRNLQDSIIKIKLRNRQLELNKNFVWTHEKIEKLREKKKKMWFRYKEAYDEVCRLKKEFDQLYATGNKNYESYTIETEFWYSHEKCNSEEEEDLWDNLCEESTFWGPFFWARNDIDNRNMKSFEEEMLYDGKSWNEYPFNTSELDGICIHYFMHDIFNHNHTYSLEDLMQMKPENFSWQVNICLEHWGKSVKHKV